MSFNDKIEALRRRMDGGGAGHQQQRAAGNDRRIDNDQQSHIAQQLAASGLIIHTIRIVLNLINDVSITDNSEQRSCKNCFSVSTVAEW